MTVIAPDSDDQLVERIYEAALDSSRWIDVLTPLCTRLNSHTGLIWANNFATHAIDTAVSGLDVFVQTGFSEAALASLASYYAQRNVWLEDPRLHRGGAVVNGSMLFSSSHLKKTEFWTDWLRHQDIFHTAAAIVDKRDDRSVNVTVCRPEGMGEYDARELALLQRLMPHLQAAFALHHRLHRLQALSQVATGALEQMPFGVVLLGDRREVVFINQRAQAMAGATRLLQWREGGPVRCSLAADDATLQRLMGHATLTGSGSPNGPGAGGALRLSGLDGRQLQLLVAPLPLRAAPFGVRTAAVIFLSDPQAVIGSLTATLRSIYQMTPAEARLTEALVNGRTAQEYAAQAGVSITTVRTQLKHAAAKAGVSRQTDLVRAVLTGPAVLATSAGVRP